MVPPSNQRDLPVVKVGMKTPKSDAVYWRTQPYEIRLAALESIRQEFIAWKYGAQSRLQRVYTVVKR
jgi:hypothetical protein